MPESDELLTFAEIAVAFAGFSSIVVLFRRDSAGGWQRVHALAFRDMIGVSLLVGLFSMLPFALARIGLAPEIVWGVLSGVLGVSSLVTLSVLGPGVFRATRAPLARGILLGGLGISAVISASLVFNALGVGFHREPGPYVSALVWLLFVAGYLFVGLVRIPEEEIRD